ncbi:hypothetical protein O181_016885 [Austropuccinia psidii MF-1]|uniref:Uncharacterized protein n=1 Tax=Austropuccinia psidii MF-1 TaxID=1389203 RepID=A0A9Q3C5S4_9BASI|nr:hypothetical protein [Austropuccinia psidii MF-1]
MLTRLNRSPDVTPTLPPMSALTTPYASTPATYNPYAPTAPSRYTSNSVINPPYASSHLPLTMLTLTYMLMCPQRTQRSDSDTTHQSFCFCTPAAYNPHVPADPSRYASNASLNPVYAFSRLPNPLLCLPSLHSCSVLPTCLRHCSNAGLILNTAYHPYAPEVP